MGVRGVLKENPSETDLSLHTMRLLLLISSLLILLFFFFFKLTLVVKNWCFAVRQIKIPVSSVTTGVLGQVICPSFNRYLYKMELIIVVCITGIL